MNRLIIVGSPRVEGRCAALADQLFMAAIDDCPDDQISIASVSSLEVSPCKGCNGCKELLEKHGAEVLYEVHSDEELAELEAEGKDVTSFPHRCVIDDEMERLYHLMDAADELIVVSPVYFAGAPAQLKAVLDRFQPFYWANVRSNAKRPATLHVVGEGGDPHGYDPLVGTVTSACAVAGFALDTIFDWVGKISPEGEIEEEPDVFQLAPIDQVEVDDVEDDFEEEPIERPRAQQGQGQGRAKLDLSAAGSSKGKGGGSGSSNRSGNGSANRGSKPRSNGSQGSARGKSSKSGQRNNSKKGGKRG